MGGFDAAADGVAAAAVAARVCEHDAFGVLASGGCRRPLDADSGAGAVGRGGAAAYAAADGVDGAELDGGDVVVVVDGAATDDGDVAASGAADRRPDSNDPARSDGYHLHVSDSDGGFASGWPDAIGLAAVANGTLVVAGGGVDVGVDGSGAGAEATGIAAVVAAGG